MEHWVTFVAELTDSLVGWVYQPVCSACDDTVTSAQSFCASCVVSLYPVHAVCPCCGDPQAGVQGRLCRDCAKYPPAFSKAWAPFLYGGQLAIALGRLKFQHRMDLARPLAKLISGHFRNMLEEVDYVLAIPLHWSRQAHRGFNPAAEVLRHLPVQRSKRLTGALVRRKRTQAQSELSRKDRVVNVKSAFAVPPTSMERLSGRRLLLFDDVITTGATMGAAAEALLQAGATEVLAGAIARAES